MPFKARASRSAHRFQEGRWPSGPVGACSREARSSILCGRIFRRKLKVGAPWQAFEKKLDENQKLDDRSRLPRLVISVCFVSQVTVVLSGKTHIWRQFLPQLLSTKVQKTPKMAEQAIGYQIRSLATEPTQSPSPDPNHSHTPAPTRDPSAASGLSPIPDSVHGAAPAPNPGAVPNPNRPQAPAPITDPSPAGGRARIPDSDHAPNSTSFPEPYLAPADAQLANPSPSPNPALAQTDKEPKKKRIRTAEAMGEGQEISICSIDRKLRPSETNRPPRLLRGLPRNATGAGKSLPPSPAKSSQWPSVTAGTSSLHQSIPMTRRMPPR